MAWVIMLVKVRIGMCVLFAVDENGVCEEQSLCVVGWVMYIFY
jgi:hypothetical protein